MSDPAPLRNRRLSPRKPPRGKIKVRCYRGSIDLGANLAIAVVEVSETGVRLTLQAALDAGQEVTILLEGLTHLRPLRLPGNIVWCRAQEAGGFQAGVQFQKRIPWAELQYLS
jgi:hypothetical protein